MRQFASDKVYNIARYYELCLTRVLNHNLLQLLIKQQYKLPKNSKIKYSKTSTHKRQTNIGCIFTGVKDGKEKTYYIYNVCDHQECYHEVGSQAISYTTGVPAMCGALMMLTGKWIRPGVYTVEEFDPDPFLDALDRYGLPRSENHDPKLVD